MMPSETQYREYLPSPVLRSYIECYWHYYSSPGLSIEEQPVKRCLPLGTVEIIIQVDQKPCVIYNSQQQTWEKSHIIYFAGLFKDTSFWKGSPDSLMFGIRMRPEAILELFKLPVACLFNCVIDAEALLGTTAKNMVNEMSGKSSVPQLVTIAEKYLLNRLSNLRAERNYVVEACRLIRKVQGKLSIEALSDQLYISPRQLQRNFKELVGTSPKTYQRIIRFRNAYQYVRKATDSEIKWAELSYELGFSDQAHFIRDCREFTGTVPSFLITNDQSFFQTLEVCPTYVSFAY
ncbi:hypothetical protein AHMF7605_28760 [Adhaeribacter arboris]|uniref:HTH araC/xylS-type domain-containing protein n=1 Tax=Adhaeribacter arboris TaxID=2072846 RepID=A0A2T2Y8S6_9BACT|nr:helix-turn-helix transcriptional regulator [Adhaeribacter arboris]PSR51903.1 hypothetical protein AHMF7605_28760 [Adhaeribacter arboris]